MPRKPRIDHPGYYHIINRGVNRQNVFLEDEDKKKFLEILDTSRETYQFTLHSFCVLDNHYHLLLETKRTNLSLAIRYINSRYAAWFNKKTDRIGPLWQGRFKSWYIHEEEYLWLLLRYIEMNPVKAGMANILGDYPFSSSYYVVNRLRPDLLSGSCLYEKDIRNWLLLSGDELESMTNFQSVKIEKQDDKIAVKNRLPLNEYFSIDNTREQRNDSMLKAFMDGYKQSEIARFLDLSTVAVSRCIEREKRKNMLFREIRDKGLFWSYSSDIEYGPEKKNILIETILKYGDMSHIFAALDLYGKRSVYSVWQQCIRHDARFKKLNYFIARIFFNQDVEAAEFNEVRNARAEKLRLLAG
ncbi:MAG: transposase [Candidatus Omnitrophica bacterium]|nr:transposase [Candidatus Omnitrophota bacterium]